MKEEITLSDSFHNTGSPTYCTVILPLALDKLYTYSIPAMLVSKVIAGMRVEVQFGKEKRYAAIVYSLTNVKPEGYEPKQLLSLIDEKPLIHTLQIS